MNYEYVDLKDEKVCFILTGMGRKIDEEAYQKVISKLHEKNISTVAIDISTYEKDKLTFDKTTLTKNITEFTTMYDLFSPKYKIKYFFGFSFGAATGLIAGDRLTFQKQILCSTGPFYNYLTKEDFNKIGDCEKFLNDLKHYDIKTYFTNNKIILLYGENESLNFIDISLDLNDLYPNSELHKVQNCDHDISKSNYMNKIFEVIEKEF